ncbi:HNH endonuclease [Salmonella enterica subsp. enterica serovar Fluntern]|uniref:HNH endonuclease n=1 Tax=Salmonella enterica TaxID=28901 RepID=UPI000B504BB5|nr:HNH endonuclease [Salmonella enterica]EAA3234615.1 HNH endonuclease [Salmonella enterica subsp. enterica serovar Fluntern]ECI0550372.1 HNH endonuclease [Salmonella enterica subsp. enterica]ASE02761.1 HNH endonuclease [Salmonella enterica subsp. enterica serovar Quebec str. S-1267]EAB1662696.1 HNH endonuclease [Salmonella enterica]EAP9553541.1 HNH endonuclease [Salmonella enterica]
MNKHSIDPRILALCGKVTRKRARTVLDHLIEYGFITTEDLQETYGYDHPPRAIRDVREEGIPLETYSTISNRTGRKIAAYRFDNPDKIKNGRIGGRRAFSKAFKEALIERYGSRDAITGEQVEQRYLQIDHRIPYQVTGDTEHDEQNLEAYMLIDASNQRAKSFTCESCSNWLEIQDPAICMGCYWAYPEKYNHVAMNPIKQLSIRWSGLDEIKVYDELNSRAKEEGVDIKTLLTRFLEK